jgi:hypothetical protein
MRNMERCLACEADSVKRGNLGELYSRMRFVPDGIAKLW